MSIQVGVVGCGAIGQRRHLPELAGNEDATIVAVCDKNAARVREIGEKYEAQPYTDFEQMLKHPDLEAVVIGTPNYLHAPMTIAALKAGKHALVEKPMALSRDEARAMIAASRKSGKFLMVGQNQRLDGQHREARAIIESGRLGRPLSFRTAFKHRGPETWSVDGGPGTWFFQKKLAGMGVCGDLGIHKADLMRYVLGEDIVEVTAMIDTQHKTYANGKKIDVDDNAMLVCRTASGVMGSIIISWTNYGEWESNYTVIYCEKGVMMLAMDPKYGVQVRYKTGREELYKTGDISTNDRQVSSGVTEMFVRGIKENKAPSIDGNEGYKSLSVILTAFESQDQGRTLKVK